MSEELKPCPFCGGGVIEHKENDGTKWVECEHKWCIGSTIIGWVGQWESRPLEDALRAENEQLREALKDMIFGVSGLSQKDWNDILINAKAVLASTERKG